MKPLFILMLFFFFMFSCTSPKGENTSEQKISEEIKSSDTCTYSRENTNEAGARVRVVQEEKFIAIENNPNDTGKIQSKSITDFFRGYLSCVSVDTVLGVSFNFKFNTDDAYANYGAVKKGNKIIFTLKSGKEIDIYFGSPFSGNNNLSTQNTDYLSFAYLPKNAAKQLKMEELSKVRIFWSKKQEDYVAVNPKIFINQIPCVE